MHQCTMSHYVQCLQNFFETRKNYDFYDQKKIVHNVKFKNKTLIFFIHFTKCAKFLDNSRNVQLHIMRMTYI